VLAEAIELAGLSYSPAWLSM